MKTAGMFAVCLTLCATMSMAGSWPQFRGTNGSGRAATTDKLPAEIGPETNVVWKAELPPGHSSPAISADKIFLTGVRDQKLLTFALDRKSGKLLWEAEAPHEKLEAIHKIGSYAQCSPVTDGERVVVFFGSSGLYCYDVDGKLLWSKRMGPFKNDFGAGSSPLIVGDRVILCQDHDQDSFLISFDKQTGKLLWQTDRSEFSRNYCTPVISEVAGKKQIVLAGTLRVVGYDFDTGKEVWTVRGVSRVVCMTPVIGEDGTLYLAGWSAGGDPGSRIALEPFDDIVAPVDANKNGTLEEPEMVAEPVKARMAEVKQRFAQCDRDKNGSVTRAEYEEFRTLFDKSRNVVIAIKPGGQGDVSDTNVLWTFEKFVPFCSSPLYHQGRLFTVKDGGILTSLDAKSGAALKTGRLPATGNYYASPVVGDGKVYILNERGALSVINDSGDWEVLHTADFGEDTYATPALLDGKIYLRTSKHLYCFGAAAK